MEQQGIYERIKERVKLLKEESKDHFFTEYLVSFDQKLIQEKHQLDLLEQELEKSSQKYAQRMAAAQAPRQDAPLAAAREMAQGNTQAAAQGYAPVNTQAAAQGYVPMNTQAVAQTSAPVSEQAADMAGRAKVPPQAASGPQKNREFAIGINVFGTIGVLFVLAALILLGINYMGSLARELGLYVVGLLVWGAAEFFVKKKSQTLSMIISSLGIGSLYVTTMVNFLYLHNFNGIVTILITTLITVVVMVVSRKKDAGILRVICMGACLVSFLMMDIPHLNDGAELLIYMVMILSVQLLGILLPVKKWAYGIGLGQIAGTALFAWIFTISTTAPKTVMEQRTLYIIGFLVASMVLMELTAWRIPSADSGQRTGICAIFGIGAALVVSAYRWCAIWNHFRYQGSYVDMEIWIRLAVMAAIVAMAILFFFLMRGRGSLCWMQGYFAGGAALLLFGNVLNPGTGLSVAIALTVLMLIYKPLAYRYQPLRVAGAIITSWTALVALNYHHSIYGYVLLGVLLLSLLLMNHWQTYYELLITITTVLIIPLVLDNDLVLPLVIAVMWLASMLFNYVKRFSGKGISVFNYTMLVIEGSCYLGLMFLQTFDQVMIYFILTVLGVGIIFFIFQPRFHMPAKWREFAMAGFLTYMILVTRFQFRITSSILLMIVGLFGIILGFVQRDRKLRIYGLVLSMLMCLKIALFDFRVESLQRIILFLVTGLAALGISGVYALMEKKYQKEENETSA